MRLVAAPIDKRLAASLHAGLRRAGREGRCLSGIHRIRLCLPELVANYHDLIGLASIALGPIVTVADCAMNVLIQKKVHLHW